MKKTGVLIFIFLLSLTFISAVPPFQTSSSEIGIDIEVPIINTHIAEQDFTFHLHAYNATDGTRFTNSSINCTIHLYSPIDGSHLVEENMSFDSNGIDFEFKVDGGNFTTLGQYAVLLDCQDSTVGGFFEYGFDVTKTGNSVNTGESLMYIWILVILAILSIFGIYLSTIIPYENIMDENSREKVVLKITMTKYMKLIVIWITSGILLIFLTVLTGMINNYVQFAEMKELFTNIYTFLRIIGYGTSVTIMIFLFINFWKDILLNKQLVKHGKAFVEDAARNS